MPPEQLKHLGEMVGCEEGGEETLSGTGGDAWALGCVASFCLNGRPLFMGGPREVSKTFGDFVLFLFSIKIQMNHSSFIDYPLTTITIFNQNNTLQMTFFS